MGGSRHKPVITIEFHKPSLGVGGACKVGTGKEAFLEERGVVYGRWVVGALSFELR